MISAFERRKTEKKLEHEKLFSIVAAEAKQTRETIKLNKQSRHKKTRKSHTHPREVHKRRTQKSVQQTGLKAQTKISK